MIKLVSNRSEFRTEHLKMPVYAVRKLVPKLPQFDDVNKVMQLLMPTLYHVIRSRF